MLESDSTTDTEATTVRQLVAIYGIAAIAWMGLTTWGLLSDCRSEQSDGQCGMPTFFGAAYGLVAALVVVGLGRVIGIPRHFTSPRQRPTAVGAVSALLVSLTVLHVHLILDVYARASHGLAQIARLWSITALLGAPFAFAIVVVIAATCLWRIRKAGHATVRWAAAVGALAGAAVGLLTPAVFGFGLLDRWWMLRSGLLMGVSAGVVFGWLGLRNQSELASPAVVSESER